MIGQENASCPRAELRDTLPEIYGERKKTEKTKQKNTVHKIFVFLFLNLIPGSLNDTIL